MVPGDPDTGRRVSDLPSPGAGGATGDGRLADNIAHFARALRRAGLGVGPGHIVEAVRAVEQAGIASRDDFYWTLHAVFVSRPEERPVFAQTFRLFWRDPSFLERMMGLLLPSMRGVHEDRAPAPAELRAAAALLADAAPETPLPEPGDAPEIEIDASATASSTERLRRLDFEQMTPAEAAAAERMLARLSLPAPPVPTRRMAPAPRGPSPDWRRTLRMAARRGGEIRQPLTRRRRTRPPALVVLCDISGSMAGYSRMVLHFVHAVANRSGQGWGRVHAFTFGTRLTNVTRALAGHDADAALAAAGRAAEDWEGGTRIAECLATFNRDWGRRVLTGGATVLLISDGLERGDPARLESEAERLQLSARRVIWLNPLLRYSGFAPRAAGIRALRAHVDEMRAGHSLASLEDLAAALAPEGAARRSIRAPAV